MKFILETTGYLYTQDGADKLRNLGFDFVECPEETNYGYKFQIKWNTIPSFELETMEQLMEFVKQYGNVIIGTNIDGDPTLTIYDDYME